MRRAAAAAAADPDMDSDGERRPFEWQLRQVWQQSALPASQLDPDRNGARGGEGGDDEVAGTATEAALREVEHDEQERGGEHTRVVLKDPGRVAEAAGESRVRTGRSGQRRVNEREPDPECGQADDRARAERRMPACVGFGSALW